MSEFSSIVAIQINEAGQPTDLVAFSEGDTIASTVLNPETRDAITRVEDSSASWDAGLDAGTYNNIVDVSNNFQSFSGNIETSTRGLSSILDASVGSGLVDVCAYVTDNESTWNSGGSPSATGFENWNSTYNTLTNFSGDIQASTRDLSSVLDASVGSGLVDVCAYVTDNESTWNSGGSPSATGFENWNSTYDTVTTFSGDIEASTRNMSSMVDGLSSLTDGLSALTDASVLLLEGSTLNLEVSTRNMSGMVDGLSSLTDGLSALTDASVLLLEGSTLDLEASTRNLSGILDSSTNFPNTLATNLEASAIASSFADSRIGLKNAHVSIATGKSVVNDASNASLSLNNNAIIASANIAVRFDGPLFVFEEDGDQYETWTKNDFRNTKIVSGDVITNLRPFSGNIEASTRNLSSILDGSTNFPNTLATNLEVSTRNLSAILDGSTNFPNTVATNLEASTQNLSGILDGSTNYPNSYITTNESDITETRTVRSVSGTAFLTGNTPTLSNDLDADGNDVNNISFLRGQNAGGGGANNFVLSGQTVYLAGKSKLLVGETTAAASSLIPIINDLASVSGAGGGGGGDFEGSAIASAIAIGNGSSVQISGTDDTAIDLPQNNMVLVLDTADERFKYSKIRGPMIIDGAVAADQLANDAVTTDKIADGEITSTKLGSGAALGNLAINSITFNELQLISAQTLVGNPEPSLGSPMQALTKAQARNILGVSAGTVAPPSPDEGDLWYDTTTGVDELFAYDSARGKWLSVCTYQYFFARNAAATTSHAHIGPGSLTYNTASRIGYYIPFDMTIVGYAWNHGSTAGETTDWTHRLQRYNLATSANGTAININPTGTYTRYLDMTLNTDFDGEALLGSNMVAGGSATSVQHQTVTVFMKRRTS